jgi:hypothetical protein
VPQDRSGYTSTMESTKPTPPPNTVAKFYGQNYIYIYRVIKKVSVDLIITVQKKRKKLAIVEYIRNTDYVILNTVFENSVRSVNKRLETVGRHFEHSSSSSSSIGPRWLMLPDVLQP